MKHASSNDACTKPSIYPFLDTDTQQPVRYKCSFIVPLGGVSRDLYGRSYDISPKYR